MNGKRNIVLYIAASMDGYIARENGDIDWLETVEGEGDNGYGEFLETIDTVVMGKSTYDQVRGFDIEFPYKDKTCYVYSNTVVGKDEFVEFVNEDIEMFVQRLKSEDGKDIWLVGGAKLLDTFMRKNVVDECIIAYIPVVLGSGISLFHHNIPETVWKVKSVKRYNSIVIIHYEKKKS